MHFIIFFPKFSKVFHIVWNINKSWFYYISLLELSSKYTIFIIYIKNKIIYENSLQNIEQNF